jgi:ATP-binding cassette subfamily B protein
MTTNNASRAPTQADDPGTLALLWSIVRFRPFGFFGDLAIGMVFYSLPLLTGLIVRALFDSLTSGAPAAIGPWSFIALMAATELVRMASSWGYGYIWIDFWMSGETLLRKNLLVHVLRGDGKTGAIVSLPGSPGETISRFRDDVEEVINAIEVWVDLSGVAVMAAIAAVIMIQINALITLLVFAPLVIIVAMVNTLSGRVKQYRRASRASTAQVTGFLGELFGAVQAVKIAAAEEHSTRRFSELSDVRRRAAVKDRVFAQSLDAFNANVLNVGTGAVLLLAIQGMRSGTFTVGDFSLFVGYLAWVSAFPRWLGRLFARQKQAQVSIDRLTALLHSTHRSALATHGPVYLRSDTLIELPPMRTAADHLRDVEGIALSFHYPGTDRGICGIDIRLRRGSFTVITGRVGSGKTTLLHVLLGLLPRQEGAIRWNGHSVADPASFFSPPRCAYTPQTPRLFSDTLQDNILLGLPSGERLAHALHAAVLEDDVRTLEDGLETFVGPRGVKLSGGQIQRTAAARMFVRETELLVFDDLSSALDGETERLLWDRLFERRDATCLVVSHRHAALERADHIIVLKDGNVEDEGTLADLLSRCYEMQRLWKGDVQ